MFGVVLAIGLLVDDAIVVVENVERVMHDEGLPPVEAARRSMDQISGALVGIALVLSAVFVPMSFFGGSTGVIYRQFSITMVSSMALSVVVAMVLTPALCATILKPRHAHNSGRRGFFGWFNRTFDRTSRGYESVVQRLTRRTVPAMVVYVVLVASTAALFARTPTAFLPDEDQGVLYSLAQLPAGATQQQTIEVLKRIEQHFLGNEKEAVESLFTVAGFSFAGRGQNMGIAFVEPSSMGRAHERRAEGRRRRPTGNGRVCADPGGDGLRLRAAGGDRARQCHRLQPPPAGSRRTRS